MVIDDLDRWEQRYLTSSIGRRTICLPKKSKVADRLIEKGIILGVGFVFGRYAEFHKTLLGERILAELLGESVAAENSTGGES